MAMIDTAEIVARRYGVSRERQGYSLISQRRTAAAQRAGRFDDEIVPMTTRKLCMIKADGRDTQEDVKLE